MRVFLKHGVKFIGADPAKSDRVYSDRDNGGGWEEAELTSRDGGLFDARLVAADRQLSLQPDGRLETRPAGAVGEYELFRATEQPEGLAILYREKDGAVVGVPLSIVEVQ